MASINLGCRYIANQKWIALVEITVTPGILITNFKVVSSLHFHYFISIECRRMIIKETIMEASRTLEVSKLSAHIKRWHLHCMGMLKHLLVIPLFVEGDNFDKIIEMLSIKQI